MKTMWRVMLLLAVMASAAVVPLHAAESEQMIKADLQMRSPAVDDLTFTAEPPVEGQQVRLSLMARIESDVLGGSNPFLSLRVNGHSVTPKVLLNKPFNFTMLNGSDATWYYGAKWRLCYSPDFSDEVRTAKIPYAITAPEQDPYLFVWDISGFVKPGENALQLQHHRILPDGSTMVLKDIKVEVGEAMEQVKAGGGVEPAPAGPLPVFIAGDTPRPADFRAGVGEDGSIVIEAAGQRVNIKSRTSVQDGGWVPEAEATRPRIKQLKTDRAVTLQWQGDQYHVKRKVTANDRRVLVEDTLTNTTDQVIGVIVEHEADGGATPDDAWLSGSLAYAETQNGGDPRNPSIIARWDGVTLGLFAENDLLRLQHETRLAGSVIRLIDRELGIAPGQSHTLSWSIYPSAGGSYWDVVNTVRRDWGSNITLEQPVIFTHGGDRHIETAEQLTTWAERLGVPWQCSHQTFYVDDRVQLAEGTDLPNATKWWANVQQWSGKLRPNVPGFKNLIYLHCEIGTEENGAELYHDSKMIQADGRHRQTPYHYPIYKYLSTMDNSYGKALQETVRELLSRPYVDGFYVDEFLPSTGPSKYHYGEPWDQATAVIHPTTHALTSTRSLSSLLQHDWRLWLIDEVRAHGKTIVGNSPPSTRSLLDKEVMFFTETFSNSIAQLTHLATPWCLGNAAYDLPAMAKKTSALLEFGTLINPHVWSGDLPAADAFFLPKMYPLTPITLAPGMILGEERIVTNRSGVYGWADGEPGEVLVYDGTGLPVAQPDVTRTTNDGRSVVELRMPSDHLAVVLRGEDQTSAEAN